MMAVRSAVNASGAATATPPTRPGASGSAAPRPRARARPPAAAPRRGWIPGTPVRDVARDQRVLGLTEAALVVHAALAVGHVHVQPRMPALVQSVVQPIREQALGALAPAAARQGLQGPPQLLAPAGEGDRELFAREARLRAGLRAVAAHQGHDRQRRDGRRVQRGQAGRYVSCRLSRIYRARRVRGNRTEHPREHTPPRRTHRPAARPSPAAGSGPRVDVELPPGARVLAHGGHRLQLGLAAELACVGRAGLQQPGEDLARGHASLGVGVDQLAPPSRRAPRGSGSRPAPPGCATSRSET